MTRVLTSPGTVTRLDTGSDAGTEDWWTLKGTETRCGCGHSSPYLCEAAHPHRVIVFPSESDPNLEKVAAEVEGAASAIRYERSFGPCVSYYALTPS